MRAPTHPTTRPRPSNSLLRRRQRRATANLLVRGVGPGGGSRHHPWRRTPPDRRRETTRRFLTMGGQLLPATRRSFLPRHGLSLPVFPADLPSLCARICLPRPPVIDNTPTSRATRMNDVGGVRAALFRLAVRRGRAARAHPDLHRDDRRHGPAGPAGRRPARRAWSRFSPCWSSR